MNRALRPEVAIFDADTPPALAFLRSLGRAGVPTRLFSHRRWPASRLSRWCKRFERCPNPEDVDRFSLWLEARLRSGEIARVAPTSDLIAFHLAELEDALPAELSARLPAAEAVRTCLFKDRFHDTCTRAGFAVPAAWFPASVAEARDLAGAVRYPAILKPKSHIGVGIERGTVVRSPAELRERFAPYPVGTGHETLAARYPGLLLPMIQAYVPSALENLFSVSGILGPEGEARAISGSRKTLQWPPTLGIGIEFQSCADPELIARGEALVRAVLGRGLFELELIRDSRAKAWVAVDLNPRAHGFIRFDMARGNDLPMLWYAQATGGEVGSARAPRNDLRWTHAIPQHARSWARLVQGPDRLERARAYLSYVRTPSVDAVHENADPLPSAGFAANLLRHPGGLIRPFLARE